MIKYFSVIAAWGIVLGASLASGQSTDTSKPKNPVLHRAPTLAGWTVQFKYADEEKKLDQTSAIASTEDRLRSVIVTKTNSTYREQATLTSGKQFDKWVLEELQMKSIPGSVSILPIAPPSANETSPDYSDYSRSDFPEVKWVSLSNYKGLGKYEGQSVFQFEAGGKTAYLSVDTQLPIYSKDHDASRIYTYGTPPTSPLILPDKFMAVFKAWKQSTKALEYHSVPF